MMVMRGSRAFSVAGAAVAMLTMSTAIDVPTVSATTSPSTTSAFSATAGPVQRQAQWLARASKSLPVPDEQIAAHLNADYAKAVGSAGFSALLRDAGHGQGFSVVTVRPQPERELTQAALTVRSADGTESLAVLLLDTSGRIARVQFTAIPRSWAELERRLHAVAPSTGYLVSQVSATSTRMVHGSSINTPRAIASGFKLYVLGAVSDSIRAGRLHWSTPITVRNEWKADSSGPTATVKPGTRLSVRELARRMVFYSDNTATDHLMRTVGRAAVEHEQAILGTRQPQLNRPMLFTRELGILKSHDYPAAANRYASLDTAARRVMLRRQVTQWPPLTGVNWTTPRSIDTVEWFASPADLTRGMNALRSRSRQPGQQPLAAILASPGSAGLGLSDQQWPTIWFKGGSEPGVLSRTFLATDRCDRTFVVSVIANDTTKSFNDDAGAGEILAIIQGAFNLASHAR